MALQRLPATGPLDDLLAALDTDGGLVVEGLFPVEVIDRMREGVLKAAENYEPGAATQGLGEAGRFFVGHNTVRFSSLGKVSDAFFDMLDNPVYAAMADAVLLPSCGSYWVNTGQAMLIGPQSPAQMLHRDCDNWPAFATMGWPNGPEITLSAMIALDTVTEKLGATRVIPGSHRWPNYLDHGSPEKTVPAELEPGDAMIYSGKTIHGGGANQTENEWRLAMHLSFVLGWIVPEESSPIDYTDDELAGRSARVRRLLGHKSYEPKPQMGGGLWLRHVDSF